MNFYVLTDPHGFYQVMMAALQNAGFFSDPQPHKLIICGDCFDRGPDVVEMQQFLLQELEEGELTLVRGNHEDLFLDFVDVAHGYSHKQYIHNGTYETALQLTQWLSPDTQHISSFASALRETPFYKTVIPAMRNWYETKNYIFTHGWVPVKVNNDGSFRFREDWRQASENDWRSARWINGMDAFLTASVPGKTVVCGHRDASYGHRKYGRQDGQTRSVDDHSPFFAPGIIALDACTALSGTVNVIVIEDEECG